MIVTISLLLTVALLLLYLESRKPKGYPPGPKWWPILGCAIEVGRIRQRTGYLYKTLSALSEKYGPVVGLKIGNDRIVALNDYNSAYTMLTNPDCDGRPIGPLYTARTWGKRRGLLVVDGQVWVEQRRFVLRHLREFGMGRNNMALIVENEALKLVEHFEKLILKVHNNRNGSTDGPLEFCNNNNNRISDNNLLYKVLSKTSKNGKEMSLHKINNKYNIKKDVSKEKIGCAKLNVHDMYVKVNESINITQMPVSKQIILLMDDAFGVTVLNTLWKMIAGKRFDTGDKSLKHLQKILTKVFKEVDMIGAPFSHFPLLRFIAPTLSGYQSFLEIHQQLWSFIENELKDHKNTFNPNAPQDLMDVYLSILKSKNYSDTFSESQLLAICVDMFMAGSETTSKTLNIAFLYLTLCPDVQKKAQEEIDRIIGRERLPTLADRPRLIYINAIVLESLRMFAGRSMIVPHRALKDTYIMNHRIPKNTMIIVNFNGLLMDKSWGDPEVFRPERFIDNNGRISVQYKYLPFGIGRHRCMGETLARSNLFVVISALLQKFTFSVVPGEEKPSTLDFVDGVTVGIKPFKVLLSTRT